MTPTFGEFASAAELQLELATTFSAFTLNAAERIDAAVAVRTCLRVVSRLANSTVRPHRPVRDPDPHWHAAIRGFRQELALADFCGLFLPSHARAASSERVVNRSASRMVAASMSIGAAVDLLATHVEHANGGVRNRDDIAVYLDSVAGRRAILTQAAHLADKLARPARDLAMATYAHRLQQRGTLADALLDVAEHLTAAARRLAEPSGEDADRAALAAVPLLERLRPNPPRPDEARRQLLDRAVESAERLHLLAFRQALADRQPTCDPSVLTVTASAMASTQAMTARTVRHLADHAGQLAPSRGRDAAAALCAAGDAAEHAFQAWLDVRTALTGARGLRDRTLDVATRTEADQLVTRLGRLLHDDDEWTPRADAPNTLRAPGVLAADSSELAVLCCGLQRVSVAAALTAYRHDELVRRSAGSTQLLVPTRTLAESPDVGRPYAAAPRDVVAALLDTYARARQTTAAAAELLGQATTWLDRQPGHIAAERALSRWRVPASWTAQRDDQVSHQPIAVGL